MDMPLGLDIREGKYCRWKTHRNLLVCSSYNLPKSETEEVQTFAEILKLTWYQSSRLQIARIMWIDQKEQ
jgi:hypothetical protein